MRTDVTCHATGVLQEYCPVRIQYNRHAVGKALSRGELTIVCLRQRLVRVRPDFILESLLFDPRCCFIWPLKSNTNDINAQRLKVFVEVAVPATLDRSAIGPGRWEEPQDRSDTLQIFWAARTAVTIGGAELRQGNRIFRRDAVERSHVSRVDGVTAILNLGVGVRIWARAVLGVGVAGVRAASTSEPEEAQ